MKIAFLMLAHKEPDRVNRLVSRLLGKENHIFIHYDQKSMDIDRLQEHERVHVLTDRVSVHWGHFSVVEATVKLIQAARQNGAFDYFWLISGEDYPIKPIGQIEEELANFGQPLYMEIRRPSAEEGTYNYQKRAELYWPGFTMRMNPVSRCIKLSMVYLTGGWQKTFSALKRKSWQGIQLYFGSQWWCASAETIASWMTFLEKDGAGLIAWFQNVLCPDELFFQTIFMHLGGQMTENAPTYVEMEGNHPRLQSIEQLEKLQESGKWMTRKVKDQALMEALDRWE